MELEKKRIFVGNLPPHTTKEQVANKFSRYGTVLSVELKQRQDNSAFAFLDLEINSKDLKFCFRNVPRRQWDGYQVKLEIARESFLKRLEKERELVKSKSVAPFREDQSQKELHDIKKDSFQKRNEVISKKESTNTCHEMSTSSENSEGEEDKSSNMKGHLPMFRGTKRVLSYDETVDKTPLSSSQGTSCKHNKPIIERDMLQKFESYSNVWKDSPSTEINTMDDNYNCDFDMIPKIKKINTEIKVPSIKCEMTENEKKRRSIIAEEKRLRSIEERKKTFVQQKQAVKAALAKIDSNARSNKRITFNEKGGKDDSYMTHLSDSSMDGKLKGNLFEKSNYGTEMKKERLFSEDESEDDNNDFKIKSQFEGKKGQKLLALQSRYANDKRFTLDERFYESDDNAEECVSTEPAQALDEKKNQLRILGSILGHDISMPEENIKQKRISMLRFDPTRPDHIKFEMKQNMESSSQKIKNKNKSNDLSFDKTQSKNSKIQVVESNEVNPAVSKEKFYKVTDQLKQTLQRRSEKNKFSLLEMFGPSNSTEKNKQFQDDAASTKKNSRKQIGWSSNPFKYDSSDSEEENEQKVAPTNKPQVQQQAVWHESFFFKPDDVRLREGLQFIKIKDDNDENNFTEKRRGLKKIIRAKIKNNQRKVPMWKKKLGGKRTNRIPGKQFKPKSKV